jgi:hypothetical protein
LKNEGTRVFAVSDFAYGIVRFRIRAQISPKRFGGHRLRRYGE